MDPHRFTVETDTRLTTVDVTDRVREAVPKEHTDILTVFVRHTTAAVVLY